MLVFNPVVRAARCDMLQLVRMKCHNAVVAHQVVGQRAGDDVLYLTVEYLKCALYYKNLTKFSPWFNGVLVVLDKRSRSIRLPKIVKICKSKILKIKYFQLNDLNKNSDRR